MRPYHKIILSASLFLGVFGALDRPLNRIRARSERPAKRAGYHLSRDSSCMSEDEAQQVATNFKNLIVEYSDALANSSLTENFVE